MLVSPADVVIVVVFGIVVALHAVIALVLHAYLNVCVPADNPLPPVSANVIVTSLVFAYVVFAVTANVGAVLSNTNAPDFVTTDVFPATSDIPLYTHK